MMNNKAWLAIHSAAIGACAVALAVGTLKGSALAICFNVIAIAFNFLSAHKAFDKVTDAF